MEYNTHLIYDITKCTQKSILRANVIHLTQIYAKKRAKAVNHAWNIPDALKVEQPLCYNIAKTCAKEEIQ